MDYKTEKIVPFVYKNKTDSICKCIVSSLTANDSSVWIGGQKGLIEYNIFKEELKRYVKAINDPDSNSCCSNIDNLIVENNGNILGGMGKRGQIKGLLELNPKTKELKHIFLDRKLIEKKTSYIKYSSNNWIRTIYKDLNGNIFVGTSGGSSGSSNKNCDTCASIYEEEVFEAKSFFRNATDTTFKEIKTFTNDDETKGLLNGPSFIEYKPGKIFFCSRQACGIFDLKISEPQSLNAKIISYPTGIYIENIFKDKSGKLWFITSDGIQTLEPIPLQHETFSLKNVDSQSMVEDMDGRIWMGTYNKSLLSYNLTSGETKDFKINDINRPYFTDVKFGDKEIIYGIGDNDAFEFDKISKSFKKIGELKKTWKKVGINFGWNSLICTSDSGLWIYLKEKGISILQPKTGEIRYVVSVDTIKRRGSSNNYPYLNDGKQDFFLCNPNQIIQINCQTTTYKLFDIKSAGLSENDNDITSVTKDNDGNLWLANSNKGLLAFNLENQKFHNYTLKDGLPTNKTSRILFVNGVIWVDHPNGIYKFIPPKNLDDKSQRLIVKVYGAKDGLPDIDFSAEAMIKTHDGRILVAADSTLISFYPDSIKSNEYVPPVFITKIEVNNHTI
ncbi:MAG TPA: two-component regulator propeller domain-containing protein [Bacteroidia bacterium]|nr:two-component regulator propeller domain-containing protein [Bacteroidia bacterium]